MKKLVGVLAGIMLLGGVAFAGGGNGANVSSSVMGGVISGNRGNDASFAVQSAYNHSVAGISSTKSGQTVTSTAFGSSVGDTIGYANNGHVMGVQSGLFNAYVSKGFGQ